MSRQDKSSEIDRRAASWDIKNAPGNYAHIVILQVASAFFAFTSVWLVTKFLGTKEFGTIITLIAASQLVQVFLNWSYTSVIRFGIDEFIDTGAIREVFWTRSLILFLNTIVVFLTSIIWLPGITAWFGLPTDISFLILAHILLAVLWVHIQAGLQAVKRPKEIGLFVLIERALTSGGLIALIAFDRLSLTGAFAAYLVGTTIVVIAALIRIRTYIPFFFSLNKSTLAQIFAYSLPLLPMTVTGFLSGGYLDAFFISSMLSTREVGIYAVATQISGIVLQFPTIANSIIFPMFVTLESENKRSTINRYFRDVLPFLCLAWGVICAVVGLFGYFIVPIVFGPEFVSSTDVLWILLASSSFSIPVLMGYGSMAHATSRTRLMLYAALIAAVTNVFLNFMLIPKLGLIGCALSSLASLGVSMAIYAIALRRSESMPVSWLVFALIPMAAGVITLLFATDLVAAFCVSIAFSFLVALAFRFEIRGSVSRLFEMIRQS